MVIGSLREARRARVYVVAPSAGSLRDRATAFSAMYDALHALGYDVAIPAGAHEAHSVDELLLAVDYDLMALEHCDYVVVLPGCEHHFEALLAPSLGKPVLQLADLAELVAA